MANRSNHLPCPYCEGINSVVKHGFLVSGKQRFRCKECEISYSASRNKKLIKEIALNMLPLYGIRGTAREVGVATSTILRRRKGTIPNESPRKVQPVKTVSDTQRGSRTRWIYRG